MTKNKIELETARLAPPPRNKIIPRVQQDPYQEEHAAQRREQRESTLPADPRQSSVHGCGMVEQLQQGHPVCSACSLARTTADPTAGTAPTPRRTGSASTRRCIASNQCALSSRSRCSR